jgi:RNA polymerase sigma-70 factor (ECF subfamily)
MHTTPPTLLERLRDKLDAHSWGRLVDLYTPLLFSWARRCGASDSDAADLVQEVFVALLQTLPEFRYDHQRGKFRNWLLTLLRNKWHDRLRSNAREEKARAQRLQQVESPDDAELFREEEYRRELAGRVLTLIKDEFAPATWQAFWETVVQGRSPHDVAGELGITENAVYCAKCKVLRRLRQEVTGFIE